MTKKTVMKKAGCKIKDEEGMQAFAGEFAKHIVPGTSIYLHGLLGAGKTTFVRGLLRGLGFEGKVKSPTYTLVEPYHVNNLDINHFDLYRINDAEELIHIGIHEYFHKNSICLVEWPENGEGFLPPADLVCDIAFLTEGRELTLQAMSQQGKAMLDGMSIYLKNRIC